MRLSFISFIGNQLLRSFVVSLSSPHYDKLWYFFWGVMLLIVVVAHPYLGWSYVSETL